MSGNLPVVELKHITKKFPGVIAVDDISIEIRSGEVVGLVGENGAGKSTLLKILAGLYQPDSGEMWVRGNKVEFKYVTDATHVGIGMVYQEQSLIPNVTVAENILLGNEDRYIKAGFYQWKKMYTEASRQLNKLDVKGIPPEALVSSLSFTQRQMVEIARALSLEERTCFEPVVLLDEPTSLLESDDLRRVLGQIRRLREHASIVFISHRLEEVLQVSDRVYVMTNGRCVAESNPKNCDLQELQRLMLGSNLNDQYKAAPVVYQNDEVVLSVKGLNKHNRYQGIDFELHKGEILGLAGVEGSGRESLCRTLFGAEPFDSGVIKLDGKTIKLGSPADATRAGISYLPAERRLEGIVSGMNVRQNITLANLPEVMVGPFISQTKEKSIVGGWIERLRIKTPSMETPIQNLSGGNQQKAIIAKWLISNQPHVLILDHPMRGLDVGAKVEVFEFIRELSARRLAMILIADTLEELIALSHTIFVMKDGQVKNIYHTSDEVKPSKLEILEQMI
jgi:ribose transport system ATP-binding protein